MRLSFEELGILTALMASGRSEDLFYTKVGGVSFDKNKRILAVCYNGFAPGAELSPEFLQNRDEKNKYALHSEANLLSQTKIGEVDTIFLTHSPCSSCAKLIAANQVKNVIFLQEYHREQGYKEILDFYKIKYKLVDYDCLMKCLCFISKAGAQIQDLAYKRFES